MEKPKVTLPKNNLPIFEALGKIAVRVEEVKGDADHKEAFINDVIFQLAEEAFLFSFTPSGEIGSNPTTPRITETFFDNFPELFGANGRITKILANKDSKTERNANHRFRATIVNLVQLFVDTKFNLKTSGKTGLSDFQYPKTAEGSKTDYADLVRVEKNMYLRMFVAVIFFKTISTLFMAKVDELKKVVELNDLWMLDELKSPEEIFAHLDRPEVRRQFVENCKELWDIQIVPRKK